MEKITIGSVSAGADAPLLLIAGPCQIEGRDHALMHAEKLAEAITDTPVHKTRIPVLHNVNVSAAADENEIKALLIQQLHNPVRWVETIQALSDKGVDKIVECGPGKVLAGLTKRIDKTITGLPVFDQRSLEKAVQALGEEV